MRLPTFSVSTRSKQKSKNDTKTMNAFLRFNTGLLKMPLPWRLWLILLVTGNLILPLVYITRAEAQVVIVAFFLSGLLTTIITHYAEGQPYIQHRGGPKGFLKVLDDRNVSRLL